MIDLRSDTVTRPTSGMRAAMSSAEVGDDAYGEDPTVRALEEDIAGMLGFQAALFVPTGTMANHICLQLLCPPGSQALAEERSHVVVDESYTALVGGIQMVTLGTPGGRGLLQAAAVTTYLACNDARFLPASAATRAVVVENTHTRAGGSVYPLSLLRDLRRVTSVADVALHCDGARVWNAHVATGMPLAANGTLFDTMSASLSKGLGAPAGSVVLCDSDRLQEARMLRSRLGGAMRQVGILAAAGRYAVTHHLDRIQSDHENATLIAAHLREAGIDVTTPRSNIVIVPTVDAIRTTLLCREHGVLVSPLAPNSIRLVTHLDVDATECRRAATVVAGICQ